MICRLHSICIHQKHMQCLLSIGEWPTTAFFCLAVLPSQKNIVLEVCSTTQSNTKYFVVKFKSSHYLNIGLHFNLIIWLVNHANKSNLSWAVLPWKIAKASSTTRVTSKPQTAWLFVFSKNSNFVKLDL